MLSFLPGAELSRVPWSQRVACELHACSRAWQTNNSVIDGSSAFVIYLPCFFFLPPTELIRKVLLENHVSLLFSLWPVRCSSPLLWPLFKGKQFCIVQHLNWVLKETQERPLNVGVLVSVLWVPRNNPPIEAGTSIWSDQFFSFMILSKMWKLTVHLHTAFQTVWCDTTMIRSGTDRLWVQDLYLLGWVESSKWLHFPEFCFYGCEPEIWAGTVLKLERDVQVKTFTEAPVWPWKWVPLNTAPQKTLITLVQACWDSSHKNC